MFPYEGRLEWHFSHPALHLVHAVETRLDWFAEPFRFTAVQRARHLRRALKVRLLFLALLSPTVIATVLGLVVRVLPAFEDVIRVLDQLLSIAGALSLVFGVLFLLVNRYAGQLERDLIACLAVGATRRAHEAVQENRE